jgi:hypothetical protein
MKLDRRIIAAVIGVTTGVTAIEYGPDGAKEVMQWPNIWWGGIPKGRAWNTEWLKEVILRLVREKAAPGDIVTFGIPGADLAVFTGDEPTMDNLRPLLHYRPMLDRGYAQVVQARVPNWKSWSGWTITDSFQPVCQISAYDTLETIARAKTIVPLCDLLTYWLSGVQGRDPVMQQDQGLLHPNAHRVFDVLYGHDFFSRFQPKSWPLFDEYELIEAVDGVYIVPASHDSVYSRLVGFAVADVVIWTGSWGGVAVRFKGKVPRGADQEKFSQIAVEGVGHSQAAITNAAFLGPTWKQLKNGAGYETYYEAAEVARQCLDQGIILTLQEAPRDEEGVKTAEWVLTQCSGSHSRALASVARTMAEACRQNLDEVSSFLGRPLGAEVAITGGWSQNEAFRDALRGVGFSQPFIAPHAMNATHAGLAAEALVRLWRKQGEEVPFHKALRALPELAD